MILKRRGGCTSQIKCKFTLIFTLVRPTIEYVPGQEGGHQEDRGGTYSVGQTDSQLEITKKEAA